MLWPEVDMVYGCMCYVRHAVERYLEERLVQRRHTSCPQSHLFSFDDTMQRVNLDCNFSLPRNDHRYTLSCEAYLWHVSPTNHLPHDLVPIEKWLVWSKDFSGVLSSSTRSSLLSGRSRLPFQLPVGRRSTLPRGWMWRVCTIKIYQCPMTIVRLALRVLNKWQCADHPLRR